MEVIKYNRKHNRLQEYDYNSQGAYFITICTKNKQCILAKPKISETKAEDIEYMELLPYGRIADKYIQQLNAHYNDIDIEHYVIMPNHIHFLIIINNKVQSKEQTDPRNSRVAQFISTFKRFCNKEIGEDIWQGRSNDHVIRNLRDYETRVKYIQDNPVRWYYDEDYR